MGIFGFGIFHYAYYLLRDRQSHSSFEELDKKFHYSEKDGGMVDFSGSLKAVERGTAMWRVVLIVGTELVFVLTP
jgi:hypothetical protein